MVFFEIVDHRSGETTIINTRIRYSNSTHPRVRTYAYVLHRSRVSHAQMDACRVIQSLIWITGVSNLIEYRATNQRLSNSAKEVAVCAHVIFMRLRFFFCKGHALSLACDEASDVARYFGFQISRKQPNLSVINIPSTLIVTVSFCVFDRCLAEKMTLWCNRFKRQFRVIDLEILASSHAMVPMRALQLVLKPRIRNRKQQPVNDLRVFQPEHVPVPPMTYPSCFLFLGRGTSTVLFRE